MTCTSTQLRCATHNWIRSLHSDHAKNWGFTQPDDSKTSHVNHVNVKWPVCSSQQSSATSEHPAFKVVQTLSQSSGMTVLRAQENPGPGQLRCGDNISLDLSCSVFMTFEGALEQLHVTTQSEVKTCQNRSWKAECNLELAYSMFCSIIGYGIIQPTHVVGGPPAIRSQIKYCLWRTRPLGMTEFSGSYKHPTFLKYLQQLLRQDFKSTYVT